MKLITEHVEDVNFLIESADGETQKHMFIEGIFLQADVKNRNGRVYPKSVLEKEVSRYVNESVKRKNAFGELGHPNGPTINPDRISHLITNLRLEDSNFIGKAKILNTPMGNIARNIMESGGKLAVSSRGLGSLKKVGDAMQVQEDFFLATAADIVINPSAPDAFVEGIMEGVEWIWNNGALKQQTIEEVKEDIESAVRRKSLNEQAVLKAWTKLMTKI